MLRWARVLPAEDVPDSLAQIQMAGCPLGLPANKPGEYICINIVPCSHLPSPSLLHIEHTVPLSRMSSSACFSEPVFQ